ncbi:TetR/AcrR family transcriptional regulator [Streptomyces avicenniae]|uniref:TetR/AcrR family transcriptional regulator n=1 Tax=Streptomyces avicenniae TaxID=500153 RepID=UPI0006992936|nr:TetR family transcriptional regulator [Streptomyces avicenniae]
MSEAVTANGLRERKKDATRRALSRAAIRLGTERGWDEVRAEDIAAEAGVSTRTFNNYFRSKEEAVVAGGAERAARVGAALLARPAYEPLWEALTAALVAMAEAEERDLGPTAVAHLRLIADHPALAAQQIRADRQAVGTLIDAVAERAGADSGQDLLPHIAVTTAVAVTRGAVEHWARHGGTVSVADTIREAMDLVRLVPYAGARP